MLKHLDQTLIIGIGNSGRRDDGLGWAFVEALETMGLDSASLTYRYQLQVEDAALVATYPQVLFVDAFHGNLENGYCLNPVAPAGDFTFTSHIFAPEAILFLAAELYQKHPKAFTLAIAGEEWELKEGLSTKAKENLNKTLEVFAKILQAA